MEANVMFSNDVTQRQHIDVEQKWSKNRPVRNSTTDYRFMNSIASTNSLSTIHLLNQPPQPSAVCSPETGQAEVESPGQDEGHPEVHVLRRSLLTQRLSLEAIVPELVQAHSVLQAVAAV